MWRDDVERSYEAQRREPSRGGMGHDRGTPSVADPREVFTRDLELPRGSTRERVRVRVRSVNLRASEARTLATVGAFRVVPAHDLRDHADRPTDARARDLRHLREEGLIRTMPYMLGRRPTTLVTLTERGRDVLEAARRDDNREPRQAFYTGIVKPRELAHDARLYQAYLRAAERLTHRGARIRRVLLDDELKRDYQSFLQDSNRGRRESDGRPHRERDEIEQWAHEHHLPVEDGHVQFPDVRIEYDERDGRRAIEDVEVVTPHYRGAHAAAKGRSGFTQYRAAAARVGGSGSGGRRGGHAFDPGIAEGLLQ
jgi:hypothetical protein